MDHKRVARTVVKAIDRRDILAATHCATRLRFTLKPEAKINQELLDRDPDVKGTYRSKNGQQYQIILGPGNVNPVFDEFIRLTGLTEDAMDDVGLFSARQSNPVMAFVRLLSDIFVPIIPALVAGGLLMALNNFLTAEGLFGAQAIVDRSPALKGLSDMIQVMASAPFLFLPILVGISAAKRFGANAFLGAVIGMIMTSPALSPDQSWDIFGFSVSQQNYDYQVIPVLAAVYVLSLLERFFHAHLRSAVDFTFTPLLSVLITGFLTFTLVGPVMRALSDLLTNAVVFLYSATGALGMGLFGLCYSAIVLTGLHQSFPAIETQLLAAFQQGQGAGDFIFVVASMANVAQGAAAFAVCFLTREKKMKGLASSSGVSALLGITEPAMFGVNLKYRFPFFCALIGAAVASAMAGLLHVIAVSLGSAGFLGFLSIQAGSISSYVVCELLSFVLAFAVTYAYGLTYARRMFVAEARRSSGEAEEKAPADAEEDQPAAETDEIVLSATADGRSVDLGMVNDPVFSSSAMGDGGAIIPENGKVYAPTDGVMTVVFATYHAYGMHGTDGEEILIHIGIDTVDLDGKYFHSYVEQGRAVKKGDLIAEFDLDSVKAAGYDPTILTIITNSREYAVVAGVQKKVQHGDPFLMIRK